MAWLLAHRHVGDVLVWIARQRRADLLPFLKPGSMSGCLRNGEHIASFLLARDLTDMMDVMLACEPGLAQVWRSLDYTMVLSAISVEGLAVAQRIGAVFNSPMFFRCGTPAWRAASRNDREAIEFLRCTDAPVGMHQHFLHKAEPPLCVAIRLGHHEVIETLMETWTDEWDKFSPRACPLLIAIRCQQWSIATKAARCTTAKAALDAAIALLLQHSSSVADELKSVAGLLAVLLSQDNRLRVECHPGAVCLTQPLFVTTLALMRPTMFTNPGLMLCAAPFLEIETLASLLARCTLFTCRCVATLLGFGRVIEENDLHTLAALCCWTRQDLQQQWKSCHSSTPKAGGWRRLIMVNTFPQLACAALEDVGTFAQLNLTGQAGMWADVIRVWMGLPVLESKTGLVALTERHAMLPHRWPLLVQNDLHRAHVSSLFEK